MGKGKHRRVRSPRAARNNILGKALAGLVSGAAVAGAASTVFADGTAKRQASDTQLSLADASYEDVDPASYEPTDIAPHRAVGQARTSHRVIGRAPASHRVAGHARVPESDRPAARSAAQDCDARTKSTRQLIDELRPDCANSTAERRAAAQELGNRGTFVSDPRTNSLYFQPMTVASDRMSAARSMSTQELIGRLGPDRGVSQDERTAAFLGLQERGYQIYDADSQDLHFNPQALAADTPGGQTAQGAPGADEGGGNAPQVQAPTPAPLPAPNQGAPAAAPLPAQNQGAQAEAPRTVQAPAPVEAPRAPAAAPQQSEAVTGGRIEIPTGPNSFAFIQAGVNSKTITISGGGGLGVGGNRSFVGTFSAPAAGVNLRGNVSLASPAASVKGEARVNFNPVTREFSGGGSGTVELNSPDGTTTSGKVSLDVNPDGEIKLSTTEGQQVDLGGRKLSVEASPPASDGTQSPPSFKLGLSGGPAQAAGKGFTVEGRVEVDATANVPLGPQDTPAANAPAVNAPTAPAGSGTSGGQGAPDAQAPAPAPAGAEAQPAPETQTPSAPETQTPTAPDGSGTPEAQAPAGAETPAAPDGSGGADFGGGADFSDGGGDFGSGSGEFGGSGGDFSSGSGDFSSGGGDFGGDDLGSGGGDFSSGGSDFGGGADFGSGGGDFGGGAGDFGGGGGDFGGGGGF
ncbi:hypothetical protein [Streptomyces nanshensis]|uniref:hypothetical protein n=1 Tax=Streptomyces nanshensis TaxID=518642 RepID=UPI00085C27C8|nr:hypothetical protein [Streptomyces nanshensis]